MSQMDDQFAVKILRDMVAINSINPSLDDSGPGEEELGSYIFNILQSLNIDAQMDELAPGRVNVIGKIKGSGGGRSLMLNAHMDTVGVDGMSEPFNPRISKGKLYGRGACDMKGSIAAILTTAKALVENNVKLKGDLVLSFVADEEHESMGAYALVEQVKTDAVIVTEPSDLQICLAHRGFGVFAITTLGMAAHGGSHSGVDANIKMGLLLAELDEFNQQLKNRKPHPLCGTASLHVPLIDGGQSLFIYSDQCNIMLERRTVPGETRAKVEKELQRMLADITKSDFHFQAIMETVLWRNPYQLSAVAPIVNELTRSAKGVSGFKNGFIGHQWWEDSAVFGEAGMDAVVFGPVGGKLHSDGEWVDLDSVTQLSEILYRVSKNFCKV